jgi:hypothetical protein
MCFSYSPLLATFQMFNDGGVPNFVEPPPAPTANAASFEIDCGTDFFNSSNFMLGLGQVDDTGAVVPSGTVSARL